MQPVSGGFFQYFCGVTEASASSIASYYEAFLY